MLSIVDGPQVVSGNTNPAQNADTDAGPSLVAYGQGLVDPRYAASIGAAPGTPVRGLFTNAYVVSTDAIPVTLGNARIAAAQALTASTPMTLVSSQGAGIAVSLPILPFGSAPTAANLVNVLALDPGFCPANTASTTTLTIPAGAWRYFRKGMRIFVTNALSGGGTLFTTVAATPAAGATTVTMSDAATASNNNVQVGSAHPTLNCADPWYTAGVIKMPDPYQSITRAVSCTGNASSTAQVFTVRGYDIYGQPMTEAISFAGGATTTAGKKAFKYIVSVTPGTTDAGHTVSIGTTDTLGLNVRTDFWEYLNLFVAGAFITSSTGWTVADATNPATTTTGDVRGTYALQTASNWDGTTANWAAARRSAFFGSLPLYNAVNASNLDYSSLFGITQV